MTHITTCSMEQASISCTHTPVMVWNIKTIDCPPNELIKAYIAVVVSGILPFLYCMWLMWDSLPEAVNLLVGAGCASAIFATYLIVFAVRQKTIFNYQIKTQSGSVEHYLHYPDFAGPLFKGIAIFTILLFLGVALVTGSLLFLVGPAAIALGAARTLLNWENPIHHRETRPWDMHNFVTIDRKRSIIVIHCTDITTGFVAHFPNKDLLEQYLQFLHTVLPPTAEFMEKDWEW
ncbi:permease [Pseudomonas capsici]|uniref:permease n=1 Tax=Pseudomonas capsici TaxID=2810614 RepID=UPI0021F0AE8D|nr:permease [Pseudomonas capsici]MCV4339693.1 permease [Pseudomonas capsici]